ncbi:alkyl/aryl-sulfatase [Aspergillus homomorphus CBS 101889]|uniref:Metallo-hydrolase/oxidoreductase n=1 Tax=Aspergillus homomorphus (strain CBS 101889) TaxID=1450537 RepID=A0A395I960_ASPHC|nr:Metallo-hydrolase/oxidoreductase [Aspergillus homomorphus CBS 101889]RAL14674.1 Metallo-hydrolase/oxidoreductase [Aspergillus homomorphus CBS 101889]
MTTPATQPDFSDRTDFENASRGFITGLEPCTIRSSKNRIVYSNEEYAFLRDTECPQTANPKLWRQGQLASQQGLFEVTPGIYQVRGLDLANMTIVEGQTGVIIIDPLTSVECASAALTLYRSQRGDRPVTGLIYSHSHIDHFGGARGVMTSPEDARTLPIFAPEGFLEEATSENIYVGPAMRRRAAFMYGTRLPKSPEGQIGCGIGMAVSTGTPSLIPPSQHITATGEERVVDGVRIQFQLVPETEAPSEMNFFFPDHRALYIAECATHSLHNIITLRGALVRDAKAWARYLDESLVLFGRQADVLCAGHNWPTWGRTEILRLISEQRDLYGYLHDQTVRMMNQGLTGIEIAENITLPPALQRAWHAQGLYGSVSHNVKGIYQRYMGWFNGNPAHLWEHPPAESAQRYVDCMGGIDEVICKAEAYAREGDLRFAATLLGHTVALDPTHQRSRLALASVFEQLGYGAENSTWRNFYLTGALDLREGEGDSHRYNLGLAARELNPLQSVEQWLNLLSVRLNGPQAATESFLIDVHVRDSGSWWRLIVNNGVLTTRLVTEQMRLEERSGMTISVTKRQLGTILSGRGDLTRLDYEGDRRLLLRFLELTA